MGLYKILEDKIVAFDICLRRILRIPYTCTDHVNNEAVRLYAPVPQLSCSVADPAMGSLGGRPPPLTKT